MKNCLIVLAGLCVCLVIACALVLMPTMGLGRSHSRGQSYMIATWKDYDDPDLKGVQVTVGTDLIDVDVPATPIFKRIEEKGHWNFHAFYCDTHLDAPAEVVVARELKNEDLELDVGHFIPSHPGKITCVKMSRICEPYPYPTTVPGQTVKYPPPKGLIRTGMLQCDLEMLPWQADKIEAEPIVITVDASTLSDGTGNKSFFPAWKNQDDDDEPPRVYTYHSDRSDASKLLVTVYHGRVVQVVGGAEETADIPYRLPSPPDPDMPQEQDKDTGWAGWLFDLLFKK